jgi:hypothetical protein
MDDLSDEKLVCHRSDCSEQSIVLVLGGKSQGVARRVELIKGQTFDRFEAFYCVAKRSNMEVFCKCFRGNASEEMPRLCHPK